jgi:hypothetical protein
MVMDGDTDEAVNFIERCGSCAADLTRAVTPVHGSKAREARFSRLTSVSKQASRSRRLLAGAFLESQ